MIRVESSRKLGAAMSGIFNHAHEALKFALNYSTQQYPMTPLAKMVKGAGLGGGRGLVGVDGAAQAGMILRELGSLCHVERAALVARCAPRGLPCDCKAPCCAGMRLSPAWEEAVRELTEYSLTALSGAMSPYRLRRGCVERYFGAKVKLAEIAEKCRVNRNTVGQHNQAITKLMKSVEHRAWGAFDELVNERGMLLVDA